jgi:hypothetical protein
MFQLSLVVYLSQVCLQSLSKVPGSQSSHSLQLCPSRHLGSIAILNKQKFLYSKIKNRKVKQVLSGVGANGRAEYKERVMEGEYGGNMYSCMKMEK